MSDDTPKFRIGSVQYLNAVPLTRGIEGEVVFATPAQLAEMLRRDELDAALVSITEVLLTDRYDILDGAAIASLGIGQLSAGSGAGNLAPILEGRR